MGAEAVLSEPVRASTGRARRRHGVKAGRGVLLLLLALGMAGPAGAVSCPGEDAPVDLTFRSVFDRARLDHTRSAASINAMFEQSKRDATIPRSGGAVGLTTSQSEFRFSTRVQYYQRSDGRYCVYLRSVDAHLNQRNTVIYVARDFPRGSCNFDVVYEHEKQHMRIHYRTLQEYAPRVKRALQSLVQGLNPMVVRTVAEARSHHAWVINDGVKHLLEDMEEEKRRRNAALDTPENYARESAKCPTW